MRIMLATAVMLFAQPAAAQWMYQKGDNAFGAAPHVVGSQKDNHTIGFRCTDKDDASIVYVMPERVGLGGTDPYNRGLPKLLVVIDDKPKIELEGTVGEFGDGRFMMTTDSADEVLPVLQSALSAQRRIAVATQLMGKIVYQQNFPAGSVKQQLAKLIKGCKIEGAGS